MAHGAARRESYRLVICVFRITAVEAIMQSIFKALLVEGYAAAAAAAIASSPNNVEITESVQSQLTKSFAGAEGIATQYPQYADQITAAAKQSFLDGDQWAYLAGIAAMLLGAALVFFLFPKKEEEEALLRQYHETDMKRIAESKTADTTSATPTSPPIPSPAP
jgi:DHA2 family multidrug resistance protein-like MFS transporter